MAKINRYYQPAQQQYVSQFVPENIGLMNQALQQRQAQSDKSQQELDLRESELLKEIALPEYDSEQLEAIEQEHKSFIEGLSQKDLADANTRREINKYITTSRVDPRLQKIREGVALKKKHDELIDDYRKDPKGFKLYRPNDMAFLDSYNQYLSQEGPDRKFAAEFIRGKESPLPGIDVLTEQQKYFKNIGTDGREWLDSLGEGDMKRYFERGWKGIKESKIYDIAGDQFQQYSEGGAGRQESNTYDYYKKHNPEALMDKEGNVKDKNQWMFERFVNAGKPRVSDQRTITGQYEAANANLQKKQERAFALIQSGKTQGYFAEYPKMEDYDNKLSELKTTDPRQYEYMLEQRDRLNDNFSKRLSTNEKAVINVKKEYFKDKPELMKQVLDRNPAFYGGNEKRPNESNEDYTRRLWIGMQLGGKQSLMEDVLGENLGVNTDKLQKDRDEYISKGEIFEAKDIILSSSKGSTDSRKYFGDQAKSAINDINWDIVGSTTENNLPLEKAVETLDKQSVKIINGINGPELYFKYEDAEGEYQSVTIQSKDIGGPIQETTEKTYDILSGGDPVIKQQLIDSHKYANLKPISKNSDYNQTEDILSYLPREEQTKFRNQDLKIVNNEDGSVSLLIQQRDIDGFSTPAGSLTAGSVGRLIDLAILK